jgi:hypothetical protein
LVWHARDGIFLFAGQDFCALRDRFAGHIMDIAPTLLSLYDTPIPEDCGGQMLKHTIREDVLDRREVRYQPGDSVSIAWHEDAMSDPALES